MAGGGALLEMVRKALKELARKRACARLRAMRGTLDLGLDLEDLREDRD